MKQFSDDDCDYNNNESESFLGLSCGMAAVFVLLMWITASH